MPLLLSVFQYRLLCHIGPTLIYFEQKNHESRRFFTGNEKIISENWWKVLFMKIQNTIYKYPWHFRKKVSWNTQMCPGQIQESVAGSEICLLQFPQSKFHGLSKAPRGQNISPRIYTDSKSGNLWYSYGLYIELKKSSWR